MICRPKLSWPEAIVTCLPLTVWVVGVAGVRLTTAKFYSPSGQPISYVGVQPDVVVQEAAKMSGDDGVTPGDLLGDSVLKAGVQAARDKTAKR